MSLAHAILGLLRERPMTGYDLKVECFDNSIAHFWQADQAQIYRTLDKLAEQGFVESQLEVQTGRPNRKVYSLTARGRAELTRWLHEPQPVPIQRQNFLVQLFFADELSNAEVLAMLRYQLELHQAQLARFQAIFEQDFKSGRNVPRKYLFQLFTLNMGIRFERAYMDWLEECIQTMEGLEKP